MMGYLEDKAKAADYARLEKEAADYKQRQAANRLADAAFKRGFEMSPSMSGLAAESAKVTELPYHDGLSEEAKYILANQKTSPKGFYDQSLVEGDVDRYTSKNLNMLKNDDKVYNDTVLNAIRENRDYNATKKALQDRQAKATSGYDGYGGGNESILDFMLFNNIDKAAVDKYNSNIDQGLAAKWREFDTYRK